MNVQISLIWYDVQALILPHIYIYNIFNDLIVLKFLKFLVPSWVFSCECQDEKIMNLFHLEVWRLPAYHYHIGPTLEAWINQWYVLLIWGDFELHIGLHSVLACAFAMY